MIVIIRRHLAGAEVRRQRPELTEAILLLPKQVRDGRDQQLVALGKIRRLKKRVLSLRSRLYRQREALATTARECYLFKSKLA